MWEQSMWRWTFNNLGGKQAGFKWHRWVLNIQWNKTAASQVDVHAILAVQHYRKTPSWLWSWHRGKETPTAQNVTLKSSYCLRQWTWFHRLFASSLHRDLECGVFALKWDQLSAAYITPCEIKYLFDCTQNEGQTLHTHKPAGNPLFSWSLGSNVSSFRHSQAEWAPEHEAISASDYH